MVDIRAWIFVAVALAISNMARADHACDTSISEPGWKIIASREIVAVKDGTPQQIGADWFVERTTTILPLCNYINASGSYSLRSYSLSPETKTERIAICKGAAPLAPYAGTCPPQ